MSNLKQNGISIAAVSVLIHVATPWLYLNLIMTLIISVKLKYVRKNYLNETKFSNSIRYIWPKIIKIDLLHKGQLCYSKDRNVTPMTILHKMRNIFIYSKELLYISTIITYLSIHKTWIEPNCTMTVFWNKHLQQGYFCFTKDTFVTP